MKRKTIPLDICREVIRRDRWSCQYCGKIADIGFYNSNGVYKVAEKNHDFVSWGRIWDSGHNGEYIAFEFDHIFPVSRGGQPDINNIVLTCRRCNRSKGDRLSGKTTELSILSGRLA